MAARGWSLHRDIGRRLAWADAIAFVDMISTDPSTWTGAETLGLDYPASWSDIAVIAALTPDGFPGPLDGIRRREGTEAAEREREERRRAVGLMSPVFRDIAMEGGIDGVRQ